MFIDIVLALVIVAVIVELVAFGRSPEPHLTRQVTIAALAGVVLALVSNWSPRAQMHLATGYTCSGTQAIEANGSLAEDQPEKLLRIRLEFIKPFPVNAVELLFVPQKNQAVITWRLTRT